MHSPGFVIKNETLPEIIDSGDSSLSSLTPLSSINNSPNKRSPRRANAFIKKEKTQSNKTKTKATFSKRKSNLCEDFFSPRIKKEKTITQVPPEIKDKLIKDTLALSHSESYHDLSSSSRESFKALLLSWYDVNKRELPWRFVSNNSFQKKEDPRNAYKVWISEIMLQQTQVETVKSYFEKWMLKFPTVKDLALADIEEVNKTWAGLGYYQRARRLNECAKIIEKDYNGEIPSKLDDLLKLPGIGPYTAGAIGSIAFDKPYEVVDGNVTRVLSRVLAISGDVRSPITIKKLWGAAKELLAKNRAGDFNQAYMDLGSIVCTPTNPKCLSCPFGGASPNSEPICKAYLESQITLQTTDIENISSLVKKNENSKDCGICVTKESEALSAYPVTRYPFKSPCKAPRIQESVVLVVISKFPRTDVPCYLLIQRPKSGLLAGLWMFPTYDFPEQPIDKEAKNKSKRSIIDLDNTIDHISGLRSVFENLSNRSLTLNHELVEKAKLCGSIFHQFSHIRQTYHVYSLLLPQLDSFILNDNTLRWCADLSSEPIPTAYQKVFKTAISKK